MENKIKVYLSARISKDAQAWNEKICDSLNYPLKVFMPHKHNPWNLSHRKLPKEVYEMDLKAMYQSDICLLLPPYGRDCAWEVGWYSNSDKLVVVFTEKEVEGLKDWMLKGGINYVITSNSKTLKSLHQDPILKYKNIIFINNLEQLSETLVRIFKSWRYNHG